MMHYDDAAPPMDIASAPDGVALRISPLNLNPRNGSPAASGGRIHDFVYITGEGASARIEISPLPVHNESTAGQWLEKMALLLAEAWGRACFGPKHTAKAPVVVRVLCGEIPPGGYYLRMLTDKTEGRDIILNAWLYDDDGKNIGVVTGIMICTTDGGAVAEESRRGGFNSVELGRLRSHCRGLSIVELDAVAPFAHRALSAEEAVRLQVMGARRKRSYIGARLACKLLSRQLAGNGRITPSESISTISPAGPKPRCPLPDGSEPFHCSVSHDSRFALAAAGEGPTGVDVEMVSERIAQLLSRFATADERVLAARFPAGTAQGSSRIWSIKEAAAKALNITLPESWRRVRADSLGEHESSARLDGRSVVVYHEMIDEHLVTLLSTDTSSG